MHSTSSCVPDNKLHSPSLYQSLEASQQQAMLAWPYYYPEEIGIQRKRETLLEERNFYFKKVQIWALLNLSSVL